jgi:hypothetical protein
MIYLDAEDSLAGVTVDFPWGSGHDHSPESGNGPQEEATTPFGGAPAPEPLADWSCREFRVGRHLFWMASHTSPASGRPRERVKYEPYWRSRKNQMGIGIGSPAGCRSRGGAVGQANRYPGGHLAGWPGGQGRSRRVFAAAENGIRPDSRYWSWRMRLFGNSLSGMKPMDTIHHLLACGDAGCPF